MSGNRYPCITQRDDEPSLVADVSSDLDVPSIVLGYDSIIPRWKTPTTLKWYLKEESFTSEERAERAATALNQAAEEWENIDFGVTVRQTENAQEANFNLVYRKNQRNQPVELGLGFFPHDADRDMFIFTVALLPQRRDMLKNVFLHELGHVFGLRHEFGLTEKAAAVQFMTKNPMSVMEYNEVPTIQETDKEGIRAFYKLTEGVDLDGSPVTDFLPKLRSSNHT